MELKFFKYLICKNQRDIFPCPFQEYFRIHENAFRLFLEIECVERKIGSLSEVYREHRL